MSAYAPTYSTDLVVSLYSYNSMNAVTRMRIVDPLKQHYTWYTYDDQGRQSTMRSIVVDGGFGVGAQPVLPAELTDIPNDPGTSVTLAPDEQFIYNERNELVSTILTGPVKRVNRTYNQRGWVTSITAKDELPFNPKLPEFQQHLEYNAAGLIKGQCWVRSGVMAGETYIYDELQRLSSYTGSNGTNAYDYDLVGNRQSDLTGGTTRVYAHGGAALQPNALVSVTGATHNAQFTYDAHGALTLRSIKESTALTATSKIEEFSYDASGLIERYQVRKAAGPGGQTNECAPDASMSPRNDWRYRFGPMKEREQKRLYLSDQGPNASLPWVYYLISPSKQQLAVYNGVEGKPCGGALGNVYMWPVEYNAYGVGGGRVITRPDNTKRFVVTDHLGSVRLTYDAQGGVLETDDYEPFGALATKTGEEARTGYIGRETDNESNLGFNGVRLYDQQYGRFLSTDAMWEKYRGIQPFAYCGNGPITCTDAGGKTINPMNLSKQEKKDLLCGIAELRTVNSPTVKAILDLAEGKGSKIDLWSLSNPGSEKAISSISKGYDLQAAFNDHWASSGLTASTRKGGDMVADVVLKDDSFEKMCSEENQGLALIPLLDELNHATSKRDNKDGKKGENDHRTLYDNLVQEIESGVDVRWTQSQIQQIYGQRDAAHAEKK